MGSVKLTILSENLKGTSFTLTEPQYTVGRAETADISIPDPTISGHHCTLTKIKDGVYAIQDVGSTNGTHLNGGDRLDTEPHELKDGDLLQIGNVEVMYENKEAHAAMPSKTMTVINLDDTGSLDITSVGLKKVGVGANKNGTQLRENKKHTAIFIAVIAVLGVCVLCGIGWLVIKMLTAGK